MQNDFTAFFEGFVPEMLKNPASEEQVQTFVTEIMKVGANVGCVIFADQTLRDYRQLLKRRSSPPSQTVVPTPWLNGGPITLANDNLSANAASPPSPTLDARKT